MIRQFLILCALLFAAPAFAQANAPLDEEAAMAKQVPAGDLVAEHAPGRPSLIWPAHVPAAGPGEEVAIGWKIGLAKGPQQQPRRLQRRDVSQALSHVPIRSSAASMVSRLPA